MKKSTILLVLVVYIISFFIVGLLGISIKSNYEMNYVNEILVTPMEEQIGLVEVSHERVELTQNVDEEYRRFENSYTYSIDYQKGLVVKLRVKVVPDNSTYTKFDLVTEPSDYISFEIKDETLVYITFNKRRAANFTLESTDGNKTPTNVSVLAL